MTSEDEKPRPTQSPPADPDNGRTVVRLARRPHTDGGAEIVADAPTGTPEPDMHETVRGSKPGSRFLRLTRIGQQKLRRTGEREFEATQAVLRPATRVGRVWSDIRHFFIGRTLATSELSQERLSKTKALAIFSSDNLSSSAYATEEILLVLILAGTASMHYSVPIAIAIALLAAIVATSYVQLVRAYSRGGGAYDVTKENVGVAASLLAGSTLCVDYILTVAVSTAAGVAAITSALPELAPARVELAVGFVALLSIGNLRGIRESGSLFMIPPYIFILSFGGMIAVGLIRLALGHDLQAMPSADSFEAGTQALTLVLILRAFASGAAALTGIEAIAEGVPSFKPPETRNASITLVWMASILALLFVGTTVLADQLNVIPAHDKTAVAQIAATVFGEGPLFYLVQVSTAMILILAANTAFAGLPTLTSVMARDGVMPKQFAFRGDRLAFTNGIIVLGVVASGVLIFFHAETHKIIPLYAFGVFMAFTLSQAGMVVHWRRHREPGWRRSMILNGIGTVATGIVAVIVGGTKFADGAWLSISAMGVVFLLLWIIRSHYADAAAQLSRGLDDPETVAQHFYSASTGRPQTVIVPVEKIDRALLRTVAYARTLTPNAVAVHITDEKESAEELRREWDESIPDMPLVIVESPYRSLIEPLLAYIEGIDRTQPNHMVTVVLPEFVPKRFWQKFLHNQLPVRMKKALVARPNTVVVEVPYHLH